MGGGLASSSPERPREQQVADGYDGKHEAGGSAPHWARKIRALGHEVRLIPAAYMTPYVKHGKTDAADAEAICEALTRPTMRFVPIKTPEQQALLVLHRTRDLLVRQRTVLVNLLRGHLAEFGIVTRQGTGGMGELMGILHDPAETRLPALARTALLGMADAIKAIETQVAEVEAAILAWHNASEASQRLATVPAIGPITATAILARIGDIASFRSAWHLAAWIGLVPKQDSTGGKPRQVGISKAGDRYLRKLLVLGATTVIRQNKTKAQEGWLAGLLARRPTMVAAIAQANKTARIVWALLTRGGTYDPTIGCQAASA